MPIDGQYRKIKDKWLEDVLFKESIEDYMALDELIYEFQQNPLAFSIPHGRANDENNDGITMMNDWLSELIILTAGNQRGKSFQGALKCLLKILPCDPDWPIFKEHGVEFREWDGPQKLIIASYKLDPSVKTVWETYLKLMPRSEVGRYAPMWGSFPGEEGAAKAYSFNKPQSHTLACGSEITMLSYQQSLTAFESMQCDIAHLDEQAPEDKFDGVDARQLTRGDYTPIIMTLTPHMVDGRRDTGANGWICRNVLGRDEAKGRKVAHYVIDTDCVPEVFMSKEKKAQAYEKNIEEPIRLNDEAGLRHGKSRYFGEPEEGGDIILSAFTPAIHMVEPFDLKPFQPTYMRFIDHGRSPCACLLMAYMPWDYIVVYKEYYDYGKGVGENARDIVEMCGNTRQQVSYYEDTAGSWPIFEEVQSGTNFAVSECDVRSFNKMSDESRRTVGQLYNQNGCKCYGASGTHREAGGVVDLLNEFFILRPNQKHLNHWLGRPIPKEAAQFGSPKIYMFDNLKNTKSEINGWIMNPATGKAFDADDHLISCLLFFAARGRRYMGDFNTRFDRHDEVQKQLPRDEYSKY